MDLVHLKKGRTNAFVYKLLFTRIRDIQAYHVYILIHADRSNDGDYVVSAIK